MRLRSLAAWVLALVVVLSVCPAYAAKSWKPRFHPKQGSVQFLAVSTNLVVDANLGLLGRRSGHVDLRLEVRQRVAESRRRGPTTLELTYDRIQLDLEWGPRALSYDSAKPPPAGAEPATDEIGRLVGQVVTFVVSRQGEIIETHGLEGLWDDIDPSAATGSEQSGALLEELTQGLGLEMLKALYQQASPIFPEKRLRAGDTWAAELTIPDPTFGAMRIDSTYELLGAGKMAGHRYVKTGVRNRIELEGRGSLLDRIGALAGAEGEVRVTTEQADGSGTIWTERKTGLTLGLLAEHRMALQLSVPLRVLGFTTRVEIPVKVEQKIAFERLE